MLSILGLYNSASIYPTSIVKYCGKIKLSYIHPYLRSNAESYFETVFGFSTMAVDA